MKRITNYFIGLVVTGLISTAAVGQTNTTNLNAPKPLTDRSVSDKLYQDLQQRNSSVSDQPISWFDAGQGYYYGTYSYNNQDYMTRYNMDGVYIETLTKKEWDANVPAPLRSSFESSPYHSQQVSSYWEVSDANRKGYYLELNDGKGKQSRIWGNEKGEFSTKPYSPKPPKK
jgi:hypothetical protein